MLSRFVWATALALLLGALHTVRIHVEVVDLGREIGRLGHDIADRRARNENLRLELERESSPVVLIERSQSLGILETKGSGR
ncbi:MAG: hypothetical protein O7E54_05195 [Planctomycetota bacterium]|jgi:hypothetical protein|nr:hypothetical protein [Planctomycetota bacterium]